MRPSRKGSIPPYRSQPTIKAPPLILQPSVAIDPVGQI